MKLAGNAVVITGAASGIGRSLARRLSGAGCPVAITDVNETGLRATAESLRGPVLHRVLDVSDNAAQLAFAAEVRDWLPGSLAAVFNNAGVAVSGTVANSDPADDQWLDDINFHGVVHGTKAYLPILLEQNAGAIVNTSSIYGLAGTPTNSAYCASKFAVRGYTDALRQELRGTGVRAINIHPGGIKTNIARDARVAEGTDAARAARDFEQIARTTPDSAARTIHQGVDAGKARILVGPDAHLVDIITRITPTHYYPVMTLIESTLRRLG
ncbi:SDR family NAD(P)-dependent oxidoreductase [Pseudonocardiaceae bacterium YIM PH 21723]|nr:SDR family NAD(P)-dependent oxidoreductase [Pseudonocardiaceae bacterium YIM PH 21723]